MTAQVAHELTRPARVREDFYSLITCYTIVKGYTSRVSWFARWRRLALLSRTGSSGGKASEPNGSQWPPSRRCKAFAPGACRGSAATAGRAERVDGRFDQHRP